MRKLILISCFALSVLSFAAEAKLRVNDEINDYKGLVNRIREEQNANQQKAEAQNKKSKEEIASILSSSSIPKAELNRIEENAKAEYPDDYTLQKAFIKGAIKTYNDLKK